MTGFRHFGFVHISFIAALSAASFIMMRVFAGLGRPRRDAFLKAVPVLMAAMELIKDLYLLQKDMFGTGYLPLHLCSLGIPVFLFSVFLPSGRWRRIFGEIALVLILPGSLCAVLFPDWNVYPPLSFLGLYSWIWHMLLFVYPILLYRDSRSAPSIRHIHYSILFLCAVVPPVYLFNKAFDCNYMFINWPPAGTPLYPLGQLLGVPGYLAGYAVLMLLVILAAYAAVYLLGGRKNP